MHFHGQHPLWQLFTRLGEAEIILPTAIAVAIWLAVSSRQPRSAWYWLVPLGIAAGLTTVTKVAFIGWGVGIASIDFTGVSGHAMFAAAIYPVLARTLSGKVEPPWPGIAVAGAYALAAMIAVSRVVTQAHSASEAIAGFALGSAASVCALMLMSSNPARISSRWLWAGIAGWLVVMPMRAGQSSTHDVVTRVAMTLADRAEPFTRADLHRTRTE